MFMVSYADVLIYALLGSVVSMLGGALLLSRKSTAKALAKYATPFAAGALLAAVFFDLLPEGLKQDAIEPVLLSTLVGLLIFFYLERFLRWFHTHEHQNTHNYSPSSLIIIGDTIHNALDGVVIASAFLVNMPAGIIATLAVAAHEIPQEIGDFGLLLARNISRRKVLLINFISALSTVAMALITFRLGADHQLPIGIMLGVSSGFLLYIAASDIIPSIHHESTAKEFFDVRPLLLLLGVIVVVAAILAVRQFENV